MDTENKVPPMAQEIRMLREALGITRKQLSEVVRGTPASMSAVNLIAIETGRKPLGKRAAALLAWLRRRFKRLWQAYNLQQLSPKSHTSALHPAGEISQKGGMSND